MKWKLFNFCGKYNYNIRELASNSHVTKYSIRNCYIYMTGTACPPPSLKKDAPRYKVFEQGKNERGNVIPPDARFIYPEFLPDPHMPWRNVLREKLERRDMLLRRANINIPEFYVGSILAVTSSNFHSPLKTTKFVGICILRYGTGLRAEFMLRNVIDNLGVDMTYRVYDPTIQQIEVLRLERRLDDNLLYLRDALPEYSTFPFDMEPEYLAEGEAVPVNPLQVVLKPRPWRSRYELYNFKGIKDLYERLPWRSRNKAIYKHAKKSFEKYDLMKQYRETIPEEEQQEIYSEVYSELQNLSIRKKKIKRRSEFKHPVKTA